MRIIDRYLLSQFLKTFLICYISLSGLFIVFDAFTNLEEFMRSAEKAGGLAKLMGTYYVYKAIFFFDRTSGFLVLVSAMFTVAWLQRHNEMTALLAAGVSRLRVIKPVLVAAVAITLLAAASRELLIPPFRDEMAKRPQDLVGDVAQELSPTCDAQTGIYIRGKSTYADKRRIHHPDFVMPTRLSEYGRYLAAEDAYYRPPEGKRPGGYLFTQLEKPKDLGQRPSLMLDGQPVLITPRDASDWLKPDECFVVSGVTFEQLTGAKSRPFCSTAQLIRGLQNPSFESGADIRIAIHSRFVQPLLDLTLLFLGLPLVLTREGRNVFIAMGLCGVLVAGFMVLGILCQQLGKSYVISSALAAWAPLMLSVPIAVGLSDAMGK
ncbi:MAG: LptF/LptG family permease [Thermoguttaceae bacterium]|jgi:lipopolysaccharide export system permease protein